MRRFSSHFLSAVLITTIRLQSRTLTRTWKRTMSSWLLAMKLLSRTPRLNQLPRQRKTLMNIFSSFPVFSTHDVYNTAKTTVKNKTGASLWLWHICKTSDQTDVDHQGPKWAFQSQNISNFLTMGIILLVISHNFMIQTPLKKSENFIRYRDFLICILKLWHKISFNCGYFSINLTNEVHVSSQTSHRLISLPGCVWRGRCMWHKCLTFTNRNQH